MKIILGIDIGGSTTKIVGLKPDGALISTMMVRAYDQLTSLYGALGNYTDTNGFSLHDVEKIFITGVGASYIHYDIYGIPTVRIEEFSATARGGLALAHVKEAVVVSMGTGTAFIHAKAKEYMHIGGSGVGGGMLMGLGRVLTGSSDFEMICSLADGGDLRNVDLTVGDISKQDIETLGMDITAANFANIRDYATDKDMALGLINVVLQTIITMSAFACRGLSVNTVILTGALTQLRKLPEIIDMCRSIYPINFIIPENAVFATAVGAALHFEDHK